MSMSNVRVVIVGSGFAGLGAAIRLKQAGVRDIVILEAADTVGGTWRDNTYPGAACDVPSHLYSFSFEPKSDWSRRYAPQQEIQDYLEQCVERYDLDEHLRFGRLVTGARFDETTATWVVTAQTGEVFTAEVFVPALGPLRDPVYPDLEGREQFAGAQMHTARWDHSVDFTGKRVAVVGTGASAVQVGPELAKSAAEVHIMQRTPSWVVPRSDRAYSPLTKKLFALLPWARKAHRAYIWAQMESTIVFFGRSKRLNRFGAATITKIMRQRVKDPALADALAPDYRMGCKRILKSDDWYRMFNRPNVTLHREAVAGVTETGLALADGGHLEVDAIVWATGFDVKGMLGVLQITGIGGADLQQRWSDRPTAHLGLSVPEFPNMFVMAGPNSGLGHNSMVFIYESQISHVVEGVRQIAGLRDAAAMVTPQALERWVDLVDSRHNRFVWSSGCRSWYLDEQGRNVALWPGTSLSYRRLVEHFRRADYTVVAATGARAANAVIELPAGDEDPVSA